MSFIFTCDPMSDIRSRSFNPFGFAAGQNEWVTLKVAWELVRNSRSFPMRAFSYVFNYAMMTVNYDQAVKKRQDLRSSTLPTTRNIANILPWLFEEILRCARNYDEILTPCAVFRQKYTTGHCHPRGNLTVAQDCCVYISRSLANVCACLKCDIPKCS